MKKKWLIALLSITTLGLTACGSHTGNQVPPVTTEAIPPEQSLPDSENETSNTETTASDDTAAETDTTDDGSFDAAAFIADSNVTTGITITYTETSSEDTADDGTVILTQSTQKPVVSMEGNEQAAAAINADLDAYYASLDDDSTTLTYAQDDYTSRLEDGFADSWTAYTSDIYAAATRADNAVISFEITFYTYNGGAHGDHWSVGRNYNAATGEVISFADLSTDTGSFRDSVLDYLVDLSTTPSYADRIFVPGTREDIESVLFADEKWFFATDGITFISDPYCLGPYAAGTIYFPIPYADITAMGLKDEYAYTGRFLLKQPYQSPYDSETYELSLTGDGNFSYDLNGDGTDDNIAFYGMVYDDSTSESHLSLFINGTDWKDVLEEQIDLSNGYLDTDYLLYDMNDSDSYVEIAVPYGIIDGDTVTYFFRYTKENTLVYLGQVTGNLSSPDVDFTTFRK